MKTGSASIEAIVRRRQILFVGFVALMGYETAEVRGVRRRTGGGVGGQGKWWTGCFLDDLRAFGINVDHQWKTAAQDEEEWRKTAEQGKYRCSRESQGWTTVWSRMAERDEKNQGKDIPKQTCSCWFTRHC